MSTPKVPKPTPVVQRQAYKDPASRDSLASATDPSIRQRIIAGVATSATGVQGPASTTKRVLTGGDTPLAPALSGGGGATPGAPVGGGASGGGSTSITGGISPAMISDIVMSQGRARKATGTL